MTHTERLAAQCQIAFVVEKITYVLGAVHDPKYPRLAMRMARDEWASVDHMLSKSLLVR